MKHFISLLGLCLLSYWCIGQEQKSIKIDSDFEPITLINPRPVNESHQPAYFVNGYFFVNDDTLNRFSPKKIKDVKIAKEDTIIQGKKYYGKIFITLKEKIERPCFIHLAELRNIYPEIKNIPTIYTIDEKLVKDIDEKLIDKNYILKIEIGQMNSNNEKISLQVVNITTKSDENKK